MKNPKPQKKIALVFVVGSLLMACGGTQRDSQDEVLASLSRVSQVNGSRIRLCGRLVFSRTTSALCPKSIDPDRGTGIDAVQCYYLDFGDDPSAARIADVKANAGKMLSLEGTVVAGANGVNGRFPARMEHPVIDAGSECK